MSHNLESDSVFFEGLIEFDHSRKSVNYTFFHTVYGAGPMNHKTWRFKGTGKTPRIAMKNAWEQMVGQFPEFNKLIEAL